MPGRITAFDTDGTESARFVVVNVKLVILSLSKTNLTCKMTMRRKLLKKYDRRFTLAEYFDYFLFSIFSLLCIFYLLF